MKQLIRKKVFETNVNQYILEIEGLIYEDVRKKIITKALEYV